MVRLVLLLLLLSLRPALAAESARVTSARMTASLITDTDAVAPGQPFRLALRLRMAPGWHTYWQNPGDAGQPPELDLTLPPGASAGKMAWPAPERMQEGPITTYAYTGEVVLPVTVTPGAGGQHIAAKATWLVCEKICVPEEGSFTLDLPQGAPAPSAQAGLFAAAEARIPRPSPFPASVAADGTLTLSGAELSPATVRKASFFPADWGEINQAARQTATVRNGIVQIALTPGEKFKRLDRLSGVVALRDPGGQASYFTIAAPRGAAVTLAPEAEVSWGSVLPLALLGGLLLNLMPCVFPVLAMKAIGLARIGAAGRREARGEALAYTAGVVLAFAGLGLALLGLRGAGNAVGWGFQFQSPAFVAGMAALLFLIGLNLSGVFEVRMSGAGVGQGLAGQGGRAGSFFTGLLAVLVATPCTAPFMGAAIAAALTMPVWGTMLIFAAMGLGLALPFLLLGLLPTWGRWLPRPGAWMDVFRGALAFPIYAACVWLLWVVGVESGADGVLAAMVTLLLVGFGAWALGVAQRGAGRGRWLGRGLAAAALLGAAGSAASLAEAPPATARAEGAERFTVARLAALRAEGRPVFVNMTASWCVTCLVNEKVALSPASVQAAFAKHHVAYLKGDWTRQDPEITEFLRAHARDGVPLYILYPPGDGAPTVLPQILTESEILSRLDRFGAAS